eukprot:824712-Prymnesium_polylepis.1
MPRRRSRCGRRRDCSSLRLHAAAGDRSMPGGAGGRAWRGGLVAALPAHGGWWPRGGGRLPLRGDGGVGCRWPFE